ncbi:MAG: 2-oxo-4-hydroxy-4-carboxy-5-ureidoimidazoline decarboxylase [Elusimicrobia bacterium]|nr:2-oxo-4-hydroxy-4-carboxy-5-ureidoimidazoline decarboxylase [Elusimicrobiota bacterium]
MDLAELNALPAKRAKEEFAKCCGASCWVERMCGGRPYADKNDLLSSASLHWKGLGREDWIEAFSHHARIGDREILRAKSKTKSWEQGEQSGVKAAPESVLDELVDANRKYEKRFGFIFLVCATGKTAAEMLGFLKQRMKNEADVELRIAAGEQEKILLLRLEKLLKP